jgi:hypothetical protein
MLYELKLCSVPEAKARKRGNAGGLSEGTVARDYRKRERNRLFQT